MVVAARPVRVLHAAAHRLHDVAAHRAAGVVRVATKAVVNSGAMANCGATRHAVKVAATTVRAQKAVLTTGSTTEAHVQLHRAGTAVHVAMAMNCPATSTL